MPDEKYQLAEELVKELAVRSKMLTIVESCTGGLFTDAVTHIPGASRVLWGTFVAYTADAKIAMLGVDTIDCFGAVSRETAVAMAERAIERSTANVSVAITGIAGPDGDRTDTPVGTVWIAVVCREVADTTAVTEVFHLSGSRNQIRESATCKALEKVIATLKESKTIIED
ncbi:MAG: CinA family protein [Treponema sp.]|jgi:PncC family amidohydrolase|nr:CinA family protein [Treponema sp.]